MKRTVQAKPPPKRPPLVVNRCSICADTWATYAGTLPRGWTRNTQTGKLACRRCRP